MDKARFLKSLKTLFLTLMNVAFALAGIVCLALGVVSLWEGKDLARAVTGLAAGLVLLFSASIERFEVLKGLGVEARTRKLDAAIDQANATLEQLRDLATSFSQVALTELMSGHFAYGSATLAMRIELHDKLLATLKGLGVSDSQVRVADTNWRKGIAAIYHSKIVALVGKTGASGAVQNVPDTYHMAAEELRSMFKRDEFLAPTPDEMQIAIDARDLMTPEIREWISDYRLYMESNTIRRIDEFAS